MTEVRKILLMRLKSIGDVILTLPAVNLVRDNFPGAEIHYLTSKEMAPFVQGFSAVNDLLVLDRSGLRQGRLPAFRDLLAMGRRLRRERYDWVVDFQGYGETGALAWLTRAPRRFGNVYRATRAWAYTDAVRRDDAMHPAEWNRALLLRGGLKDLPARNEFRVSEAVQQAAQRFCTEEGLKPGQPLLFLQPFTSSPFKDWPLENYLALARHWRERGGQVFFGGGPADRTALEPARTAGFSVCAGAPKMTDVGLMNLSTTIVGGDTGFLHLAAALGKRVLMLMLLKLPGSPVPFGHPEWAFTPPAGSPMSAIQLNTVLRACMASFDERPA